MASRPARTLTSILGIAVGVATVLAVIVVDHNTILTEQLRRPSWSGRPDLEIRPLDAGAPAGEVPAALAADPALRDVLPLFFSAIRILPPAPGAAPQDVQLVALHPDAGRRFRAFTIVEGEPLSANDAAEVLLPAVLAAELKVGVGDRIDLQRALPRVTGCREGQLVTVQDARIDSAPVPFRVAGLIAADDLGRRRAVLVPYLAGLRLYTGAHVQPVFWARLAPEAIYQDVRERLKASFVVDKPKGALVGERVDQRAFRKSVRIAAFLSLLLGLFVIYNAFSLALVERVREIGLLRALGLTSAQVGAAVVLEGLVLALLGALAGLLLAVLVVLGMQAGGITTLGFGKPLEIHAIPWDVVAVILLAGVLAALLGVVAPLLRVRRLSVIEAVRAGQIAYRPDPTRFVRALVLAVLPGLLLAVYWVATPPLGERQSEVFRQVASIALWISLTFGVALLFPRAVQVAVGGVLRVLMVHRRVERPVAAAAVRGGHHRVFGSTLGIALVLAGLFAIHVVTGSLKDESRRFAARSLGERVFVRTREVERARLEPAAAAPGVAGFYSLSAEVHAPFPIRGVDPEQVVRHLPELGRDEELAERFRSGAAIVLSEFLAASYGYGVGDVVLLSTWSGAYPVRVGAISDRFGYWPDDRSFAVLAQPVFRSLFCVDDTRGTQYVFHAAAGADPDDVQAAIVARLPEGALVSARSAQEIAGFYAADMRRDFWIFHVILVLTGLLAFVGLWNALTVALLELRREICLLRTLGFTPGQLGGMLAAESAALGVVGGGLALLAGRPIAADLVEAIRVISRLDVRPATGAIDLVVVPVLAVLIALLATVPPALRVKSQVVASATRME